MTDNTSRAEPCSFPPGTPKFPADNPEDALYAHACMGLNACKNLGRTQDNDCAGQGYCSTTPDHTCHVTNACRHQGGCGLYGTAEELANPGANDCRYQGSCAQRRSTLNALAQPRQSTPVRELRTIAERAFGCALAPYLSATGRLWK